jgi:hypothetical protein
MSPRRRRLLSRSLAGLAVFALLVAVVGIYATRTLYDSETFSNRAVSVLEDEAVQDRLASSIADAAVAETPDAIAVRPLIETVARSLVSSEALQSLLASGVEDVHRTVIKGETDTVTVTIADVGLLIRQGLEVAAPEIAKKVPRTLDADVLTAGGAEGEAVMIEIAQLHEDLRIVNWIGLALFLLAAAGSVALAPSRLAGIRRLGRAAAIAGLAAVVAWQLGRAITAGGLEPETADAVRAVWDAFGADLRVWFALLAGAGIVTTAGASSTREPIDIAALVGGAWERLTLKPDRTWTRIFRAVALLVTGVLIVTHRDEVVELIVLAVGAFVIYAGAAELMRVAAGGVRQAEASETAAAESAAEAEAALGGGALARMLAVGVLLLAGMIGLGVAANDAELPPLRVDTCNGSVQLCDRPLDEVAFAATHNSMSGASYPNWFFAQHERGITEQLQAGYRGLLLDPHYGVETPKGVATDLQSDTGSREKIEAGLGPEAVAAAERLRSQIGYTGGDEPEVFLCHAFCEVGAIRAKAGFREVADFLTANPGEVVVMSIEDATSPEDTIAALEEGGLTEFVYRGPNGPWPTLGEMIDSGERLLVMAERQGGEPTWYRDQFAITQETPYTFDSVGQLEQPSSCDPNRGPADAPFFLLNNWVDTSPAPRPTNAKKANARRFLLDRIEMCERIRGIRPNIIAVDFYAEGEVPAVVDELNGEG